jgi:hypothetical protein
MADNVQVADNGAKQCRTEESTNISSNDGERDSTQKLLFWDVRPYSFQIGTDVLNLSTAPVLKIERYTVQGKLKTRGTMAMSEKLMVTIGNLTATCSQFFPASASISA